MPFEFKRRESVRKAVRRLGRRGTKNALRHVEHCGRLEAVHEVRKEIKRLERMATDEAETLKALVDRRQKQLRAQAFALGARFYEEKPSVFCKRLGRYWKRWRREPKRAGSAA